MKIIVFFLLKKIIPYLDLVEDTSSAHKALPKFSMKITKLILFLLVFYKTNFETIILVPGNIKAALVLHQ